MYVLLLHRNGYIRTRPMRPRRANDTGRQREPGWSLCNILLADLGTWAIGARLTGTDHVRWLGHRVQGQISIFSASSMAWSTSMPR